MEFDNATTLDRKSGVPGTMMIRFLCLPKRAQPHSFPRLWQSNGWASPGEAQSFSSHVRRGERGAPSVAQPVFV
jgi:hypothetical protein